MRQLLNQAKDHLLHPKESLKLGRVGVLGDLAIDRFVFGSVDRISPEAPVPVLLRDRVEDKPGCAANVVENLAVLAQDLPLEIQITGVVGKDATGIALEAHFDHLSRVLSGRVHRTILVDETRPTTLKTRYIAGSHHQMLRVDEESSAPISSSLETQLLLQIQTQLLQLKCLVFQDYSKGVLTESMTRALIDVARAKKIFTIVDPNRRTPAHFYKGASLITPNVDEAEAILGYSLQKGAENERVAEAGRDLRNKLNLQNVIITRSRHGMTLVNENNEALHFPAIARSVFDVTGAGDTVVAVLAASHACGISLPVSCVLATAAASVVVGKVGTASATRTEILNELEFFQAGA